MLIFVGLVSQTLDDRKVESVGFLVHSTSSTVYLTGKDDKVVFSHDYAYRTMTFSYLSI